MRSCILVVHQLLFIFRELLDMAIQHFDLVQRSPFDLRQIAHQLLIVHPEVALVTDAIRNRVLLRQLAFLIAANLTDRLAASLAVTDWVAVTQAEIVREGSLTEIAILLVRLPLHLGKIVHHW